jgi:hypothetical protein
MISNGQLLLGPIQHIVSCAKKVLENISSEEIIFFILLNIWTLFGVSLVFYVLTLSLSASLSALSILITTIA